MDNVPLWLSIVLYAVAAIAVAAVLYLLMLNAMRQALREPLAELRTARRRQEDLLREISSSAGYLADVADVWAEREADRGAGGPVDAERAAFGPGTGPDDDAPSTAAPSAPTTPSAASSA